MATSIGAGALAGVVAFALSTVVLGRIPFTRAGVVVFAAAFCALTGWLVRRLPDSTRVTRVRTSPALLLVRAACRRRWW